MPERRWFNIAETAAYFSIKRKSLYSLIGRNLLPKGAVLKIGRQIRVNVQLVEASAALSGHRKGRDK